MNIADYLVLEAKRLAASRRTSLARVVEDSLRKYLAEYRSEASRARAPYALPTLDAVSPRRGIDLDDTSDLWDK